MLQLPFSSLKKINRALIAPLFISMLIIGCSDDDNEVKVEKKASGSTFTVGIDAAVDIEMMSTSSGTYRITGKCSENGRDVRVVLRDSDDEQDDNVSPEEVPVCKNGKWEAELRVADLISLANGKVTIMAIHTNKANDEKVVTFTVDKDLPVGLSLTPPADINSGNVGHYPLAGRCSESGTSIQVQVKVGVAGTLDQASTSVNCQSDGENGGTWAVENFDVSGVDDSDQVIITVSHGPASETTARVMKDVVVPAAPTITSPPNIDATNGESYTVSGGCESGATVTVAVAGGTITSDGGNAPTCSVVGEWSATFNMARVTGATAAISATQADSVGNTSGEVTAIAQVIHNVAFDTAPGNIVADTGTTYTLGGTCTDEGAAVSVTVDGISPTNASVVCSSGQWSADFQVASMTTTEGGTVEIAVSHSTAAPLSPSVLKDTVPPAQPVISTSDTIDRFNDNDLAYTVTGTCTAGAGEEIAVAVGAVTTPASGSNPTCSADGSWTAIFDVSSLPAGPVAITATQIDSVGNASPQASRSVTRNNDQVVTVDNPAPAHINTANVANYPLGGTCSEGGEAVTVNVGVAAIPDQATRSVNCGSDQTWSVTGFDVTVVDDSNQVIITVRHGTATPATGMVTKDVTPPSAPTIATGTINRFNDHAYTVTGTCIAGAGEEIAVVVGGVTAPASGSNPTCRADGSWTATFDVRSLLAGPVTITAIQTDSFGNASPLASRNVTRNNDQVFTVDNPAPAHIIIANVANYPLGGTCSEEGGAITVNVGVTATPDQATTSVNCRSDQTWSVTSFDVTAVDDSDQVIITVRHGTATPFTRDSVRKDAVAPAQPVIGFFPDIDESNENNYVVEGTCASGLGERVTVTVGTVGTPSSDSGDHPTCSATFNQLTAHSFSSISTTITDNSFYPEWVDLDNDGDFDLILGERGVDLNDPDDSTLRSKTTLSYYKNEDGTYTKQTGGNNPFDAIDLTPASGTKAYYEIAPTFADLDNDGDFDLVVGTAGAGQFTGGIHYYKNSGSATSAAYAEQTGTANPFSSITIGSGTNYLVPKLVDLDNDNDFDLVLGSSSGTFRYYKNTGSTTSATYAEQTGTANPFNGHSLTVISRPTLADLDGDGDFDLMAMDFYGKSFYYENTGSNTSASYTARTEDANPFKDVTADVFGTPLLADVDGDGDFDLLVGITTIRYYENRGGSSYFAFASWRAEFDVTSLGAGEQTITATQTDGLGNPSTQASETVQNLVSE